VNYQARTGYFIFFVKKMLFFIDIPQEIIIFAQNAIIV